MKLTIISYVLIQVLLCPRDSNALLFGSDLTLEGIVDAISKFFVDMVTFIENLLGLQPSPEPIPEGKTILSSVVNLLPGGSNDATKAVLDAINPFNYIQESLGVAGSASAIKKASQDLVKSANGVLDKATQPFKDTSSTFVSSAVGSTRKHAEEMLQGPAKLANTATNIAAEVAGKFSPQLQQTIEKRPISTGLNGLANSMINLVPGLGNKSR
ncbi:unnamed protein product [Allacma fusca]|uniref:Uncharacterized protein n=1 Tax=Allacma fusca TaxID=39272 RepID=A0A8J2LUF5_9HEXA|nr:unnamed protein product [Allacma fusca]